MLAAPGAGGAFPAVRANPADRLADAPIDDFAYDFARKCRRSPRSGTLALEAWLGRHFRGVSWGIMRCEKRKDGKRRRQVDETIAHRNQVHIGLNRRGAARRTSFWAGR